MTSRTAATRQGSIAGYFARTPTKARTASAKAGSIKREIKEEGDGVIDLTESEDIKPETGQSNSPWKRRKVGSASLSPTPLATLSSDRLALDLSQPFDFPPPNHPSYSRPPAPGHHHPISIRPPPTSLLEHLSFSQNPKVIIKPSLNLDLLYFHSFIAPPGSRELYDYFLEELPWYRVKYTVRGININTPRWTTVFGKDASTKDWTGYNVKPRAIPEILLRLMEIVEKVTGETYNFTLVNYYADGNDSISYHSDSESFLGHNPCIASVSLGSSRDFMLRHVDYRTNGAPVEKFALKDGDMVVMRQGTQKNWMHAIPKRKGVKTPVGGRINVTFRKGIVKYATKNYLDYNVGSGPMYRWIGGEMVEQPK